MTTGCLVVGEPFRIQTICLSWISASFTKGKMHDGTFLVRVVHFAGYYIEPLSFNSISKVRYKSPRILAAESPPGIRNHTKSQLNRILPNKTSTTLTKKFPTENLSAHATCKLGVGISKNTDASGPMCICIFLLVYDHATRP
jgi:hypothetical protein